MNREQIGPPSKLDARYWSRVPVEMPRSLLCRDRPYIGGGVGGGVGGGGRSPLFE